MRFKSDATRKFVRELVAVLLEPFSYRPERSRGQVTGIDLAGRDDDERFVTAVPWG